VVTFDGARPSFYGEGDFWIVKSHSVRIQGRYLATKYTHGLAATSRLAVGGPFLHGHVIVVGTMDDGVLTVDGQPVLTALPSTYTLHGLATLRYDNHGTLVDKATSRFERHIVHMELPEGVHITVLRWGNYLDLRIRMSKIDGMDGACGNYNGKPDDDTTTAIMARVGARVHQRDMLFKQRAVVTVTAEMRTMLHRDCAQLATARSICQKLLPDEVGDAMTSCLFNECFGFREHALRTAKTYS